MFYGDLGYFMTIWYHFPGFGIMYQEKSGNPAKHAYMCTYMFLKGHRFAVLGVSWHVLFK
jgi:hypothetical protein